MSTISMPPCCVRISTRGGKSALFTVLPALAAPFLLVGLARAFNVFTVVGVFWLGFGEVRLAEARVPLLLALALSS